MFFVNLLFMWCTIAVTESHICDNINQETPKHLLASKTGYFNAQVDEGHWKAFNEEVWGCTAKQVWILVRHGTRYPTKNDMGRLIQVLPTLSQQIVENHHQGRGCLGDQVLEELSQWFPPYEVRDREQLHTVGFDELLAIGEYWKQMFPHLFNVTYDSSKFKVEFTIKNRTGQSAYHFLRGMFGEDAMGEIELPVPFEPNYLLKFYKSCPKWLSSVYKNKETTYKERILFVQTPVFQAFAHAVSARLGFMYPLSTRELESIYDECRYEIAWWPERQSAWCNVFTLKDFDVMEYYQDLKYYYEDSYGHPLNPATACRTIGDLYHYFKTTVVTGKAKPQGIFYFAHDKTLFKVLAKLGLFKPSEHLRHDNYAEMINRTWKTSLLTPFGGNIGFVIYRCGMQYKIGIFLHGQPIPLSQHCRGVTCNWDELSPWLSENDKNCDLFKLCNMHEEL